MKIAFSSLLFFLAASLLAQNDLQANVNLQFRFANPGARAAAMGGAFVGLADDTTAIFANPAGLTQMRSQTVALEGNQVSRDNPIPFYQGRIDQTNLQDFEFNLQGRNFSKDTTSVPFVGFVSPKNRLKWGVFLAEQGNFERDFDTLGVGIPPYSGGRYVQRNELEFFPPSLNYLDLQLQTLGVTLAGKLGEKVSIGATLGYSRMDYSAGSEFFFPNLEELFPDITFSPRDLASIRPLYGESFAQADMSGKDEQVSVYAGVLFTPSPRFSVGLAYKNQPDFDYNWRVLSRDDAFEWLPEESGSASFNVPDSYGLGFSFKPSDVAILSFEVNRVAYSELSDDYLRLFEVEGDTLNATQAAPDVTEYHLGFEYVVTSTAFPLSLRMGYWHEPYHALQNTVLDTQLLFRFLNSTDTYVQGSRATAFLHRFATDLNHLTLGMGLSLGKMVVDVSADIDEENRNLSMSGIYRF